jgi:hypothetical protein
MTNAFQFSGGPISGASGQQAGVAFAQMRMQRQKEDEARERQNAFSEVMSQSIDPETGQIDARNAFIGLRDRGLGSEAIALGDMMTKRLLTQAQIAKSSGTQWSKPEPALMGGKEVFIQSDQSGNVRLAPGDFQPRPQKPLVDLGGVFEKEKAKKDAEDMQKAGETAGVAQSLLDVTQRAKNLLPQIRTGAGAGAERSFGSALKAFDFDPTKLGLSDPAKMEQFESAASNSVGLIRQVLKFPASGFSDADREMLERSVAGIGKNVEANAAILDAAEKVAYREQERLKQMDDWVKKNKNLNGFQSYWVDYQRKNPLFQQSAAPTKSTRKPGDIVRTKNGPMVIQKINEDGSYEAVPAQ